MDSDLKMACISLESASLQYQRSSTCISTLYLILINCAPSASTHTYSAQFFFIALAVACKHRVFCTLVLHWVSWLLHVYACSLLRCMYIYTVFFWYVKCFVVVQVNTSIFLFPFLRMDGRNTCRLTTLLLVHVVLLLLLCCCCFAGMCLCTVQITCNFTSECEALAFNLRACDILHACANTSARE